MTEAARRRRPSPVPVIWGSVVLFAVLFALLTYKLDANQATPSRPIVVRKLIKHRVVTTVIPAPGPESVSSSTAPVAEEAASVAAEPVTTSSS